MSGYFDGSVDWPDEERYAEALCEPTFQPRAALPAAPVPPRAAEPCPACGAPLTDSAVIFAGPRHAPTGCRSLPFCGCGWTHPDLIAYRASAIEASAHSGE